MIFFNFEGTIISTIIKCIIAILIIKFVMKIFTKGNNNIDQLNNINNINNNSSNNNNNNNNNSLSQYNGQLKQRIMPPNIYINPNLQSNIKELKLINSLKLSQSSCTITLSFSKNIINKFTNKTSTNKETDNELLNVINTLSNISILFLLFVLSNDQEEEDIRECIIIFFPNFPIHRLLFYIGTVGKIAIVRQVKPVIHIDFDTSVCESLNPHVRSVIEVNQVSSSISVKKSNWREILNLNELFDISL
jgi:hypothetical protein